MPHDSNGKLIELGDVVKVKCHMRQIQVAKQVVGVYPDTDSCNVQLKDFDPLAVCVQCETASDCVLLLKHDGSEPI